MLTGEDREDMPIGWKAGFTRFRDAGLPEAAYGKQGTGNGCDSVKSRLLVICCSVYRNQVSVPPH